MTFSGTYTNRSLLVAVATVFVVAFGSAATVGTGRADTSNPIKLISEWLQPGNGDSSAPSVSADGRYVAFQSDASNLVEGDNNKKSDIFVYDREGGTIKLVTKTSGGQSASGDSYGPSISADGNYVAFGSYDTNLVAGDTNGYADIFVADLRTGSIKIVTKKGDDDAFSPSISADGSYVSFVSFASSFVEGDDNRNYDVFVTDLQSGSVELISRNPQGKSGNGASMFPSISADGSAVTFESNADDLASGDYDRFYDVFVYDRNENSMTSITKGSDRGSTIPEYYVGPSISADGRLVVFDSKAENLAEGDNKDYSDVFVHDRVSGATRLVTKGNGLENDAGDSHSPLISDNGRYVAFESAAKNLVPDQGSGDTHDIYIADLNDGSIGLLTAGSDESSSFASISADGRYVAFDSYATNLVESDTNSDYDVFLYDGCIANYAAPFCPQSNGGGSQPQPGNGSSDPGDQGETGAIAEKDLSAPKIVIKNKKALSGRVFRQHVSERVRGRRVKVDFSLSEKAKVKLRLMLELKRCRRNCTRAKASRVSLASYSSPGFELPGLHSARLKLSNTATPHALERGYARFRYILAVKATDASNNTRKIEIEL